MLPNSKDKFFHDGFCSQGFLACSKKFVQQGRSLFCARSVPSVREHGKMARTPLTAFFNSPWTDPMNCLPKNMCHCGCNQALWSHAIHEEGQEKVAVSSMSFAE